MERADIAGLSNALREAFVAAGKDIEERKVATGSAFFTAGRAIGQFESRANALRARLWLTDRERQKFESRPTFDADSGWLHVVSDGDIAFVRGLMPSAYKAAATPASGAAPSAPRQMAGAVAPWTVEPGERRPRVGAAAPLAADKTTGEKKKSAAPRRSSPRI